MPFIGTYCPTYYCTRLNTTAESQISGGRVAEAPKKIYYKVRIY